MAQGLCLAEELRTGNMKSRLTRTKNWFPGGLTYAQYPKRLDPPTLYNHFPDWNARQNWDIRIHNEHAKLRKPSFSFVM